MILDSSHFSIDEHIPNLFALPPSLQLHEDTMYLQGKFILQDKASCFPAVVLAPPADDNCFVIDATAAPGNKTTHLSALMENKGKVYQPSLSVLQIDLAEACVSCLRSRG